MPGETLAGAGPDAVLGYFGKVPTHGDFVRRALPKDFLDPWDDWLQSAVAFSKQELSESWLEIYLTSPVWRFALAAGLCGDAVVAGVLMPSVDAVGRYFPMTIAGIFRSGASPFHVADAGWLAEAQEATLSCLEKDFTLESFDSRLDEIAAEIASQAKGAVTGGLGVRPWPVCAKGLAWTMDAADLERLGTEVYPALLDATARSRLGAYSIWWSDGSDRIPPCLRLFEGLPAPSAFIEFLTSAAPAEASLP
ncbi:MAG: type VI secretion system-associated protein TagF [Kiloniellales bacterium]|nr:type VI secretion system-associated protein TagF [Kiloniellales bacterium]